jgi:hypothetical protein
MKETSRKRKERTALVKQSDQARLDEEGYERPTPVADVLFTLEAEATVDPEQGGSWKLKATGRAPADSALGRTLATVPLSAILVLPPFTMGLAGSLFVKIPLLTAGMSILGLIGGAWFAWYLTRSRTAGKSSAARE